MSQQYPPKPSLTGMLPGLTYPSAQLQAHQNTHNPFDRLSPANPSIPLPSSTAANGYSLNVSSFDANTHIPSLGPVLPPRHFQLTPELLRHFGQTLPPPPPPSFPPVPIPNPTFSQFQPPSSFPNNLSPPLPPADNSVYQAPASSFPTNVNKPPPVGNQNREEGELSDGELQEDSPGSTLQTVSQEGTAGQQVLQPTIPRHSHTAEGT